MEAAYASGEASHIYRSDLRGAGWNRQVTVSATMHRIGDDARDFQPATETATETKASNLRIECSGISAPLLPSA